MKKEFNVFYNSYINKKSNQIKLRECFNAFKKLDKDFAELEFDLSYEKIILFCEVINQYKLSKSTKELTFNELAKQQCYFFANNGFSKTVSWDFIKLSNFNLYKEHLISSNKKADLDFFNKIAINETTSTNPFKQGKKIIWKDIINFYLSYNVDLNEIDKYFVFLAFTFYHIVKNQIFVSNNLPIAITTIFLSTLTHKLSDNVMFDISFKVNEYKTLFTNKLKKAIQNPKRYLEEFVTFFVVNILKESFIRSSQNMNYFLANSQLTFFKFRELFKIQMDYVDFNLDIFAEPYFDQLDLEYSFGLSDKKLNDVMETIVDKKLANVILYKNHQVFLTFWWINLFFEENQNQNRMAEIKSKEIWDSMNRIRN